MKKFVYRHFLYILQFLKFVLITVFPIRPSVYCLSFSMHLFIYFYIWNKRMHTYSVVWNDKCQWYTIRPTFAVFCNEFCSAIYIPNRLYMVDYRLSRTNFGIQCDFPLYNRFWLYIVYPTDGMVHLAIDRSQWCVAVLFTEILGIIPGDVCIECNETAVTIRKAYWRRDWKNYTICGLFGKMYYNVFCFVLIYNSRRAGTNFWLLWLSACLRAA